MSLENQLILWQPPPAFREAAENSGIMKAIDDWVVSVSDRIGILEQKGLSTIKTAILYVEALNQQSSLLENLRFTVKFSILSQSFNNDLLSGPQNLGINDAAIFLPQALSEKEINEKVRAVNHEFNEKLYSLALMQLRNDIIASQLIEVIDEASRAILGGVPSDQRVDMWTLYNNLMIDKLGQDEDRKYVLNQPTSKVYEKIRQEQLSRQESIPISTLTAALFCYNYTLLNDDRLPEEAVETIRRQVRMDGSGFWNSIREEEFPGGFGNVFDKPAILKMN
ncbi:hypothetical protein A2W14_04590 [Candidatus Gottesmanbacteria bacterium RBG_16_37_8]|uniref:Uncharacterized protein n=1 Tax=Candidatus Gottesmanbacteria bacterium RBG_16_37_8 TaxID=1798371 RepID=A0A1F5YSC8_9BACT|nr:MAG: hypothetical protein A2W14_04590 [Candidatus Gottesmanbacteria bacterium RBG_16_37_8]